MQPPASRVEKIVRAFFRYLARKGALRPTDDRIAFRVAEITRLIAVAGEKTVPASSLLGEGARQHSGLELPYELILHVGELLHRISGLPVGMELAWNVDHISTTLQDAERLVHFELSFADDLDLFFRSIIEAVGDVTLEILQAGHHLEFFVGDPNTYLPANASKRETRWTRIPLGVAAWVAAGVRPQARAEWIAETAAAQDGEVATTAKRLYFAVDLLRAALRIRCARLVAPLFAAFDRVACSDKATFRCVGLVTAGLAAYVFQAEGLMGVISDGESLFTVGGGVYGVLRWRRRILKEREEIVPSRIKEEE